jgi:hypothetical protein
MMLFVIIGMFGWYFVKTYHEMKTFNKYNPEKPATYMEALCSELRIVANGN